MIRGPLERVDPIGTAGMFHVLYRGKARLVYCRRFSSNCHCVDDK